MSKADLKMDLFKSAERVEEKERLLKWLKSRKDDFDAGTITNYICLVDMLEKAGWKREYDLRNRKTYFTRPNQESPKYPLMTAARMYVEEDIKEHRNRHLRKATNQNTLKRH